MGARLLRAAACASVTLLATSAARAEGLENVALNKLEPAPAGDPFFGVPSPFIGGHLALRGALTIDHAIKPLVLTADATSGALVSSQTLLHINASFALWDRLVLGALLPVVVAQGGDDPFQPDAQLPSPTGAAVGDLRLTARVRLFGADSDPFQLAAGVHVHLPTGAEGQFVGEGAVRDAPHLIAGGRASSFVWSANVGAVIRASKHPSMLTYGAAVGVLVWNDRIQVGPEVYAATPLQEGSVRIDTVRGLELDRVTNLEVLLGARAQLPLGFVVGAAGGPGLTDALGTPALRVMGMVGWAHLPPSPESAAPGDTDEDGLVDAADACPYAFGPTSADAKRSGCPVVDGDEDGVPDADDACPSEPGDAGAGATKKGCPEALVGAGGG